MTGAEVILFHMNYFCQETPKQINVTPFGIKLPDTHSSDILFQLIVYSNNIICILSFILIWHIMYVFIKGIKGVILCYKIFSQEDMHLCKIPWFFVNIFMTTFSPFTDLLNHYSSE